MRKNVIQRMEVEQDTLIITDPCYFIREESDWSLFCTDKCFKDEMACQETLSDLGFGECICASTGYGDWSNYIRTTNLKEEVVLGEFCADAGMVAVVTAHDLMHYSRESYELMLDYVEKGLATLIHDFTGTVTLQYESDGTFEQAYIIGESEEYNFSSYRLVQEQELTI